MSRTILCKLLQRKTYDILSKKHTLLFLIFGFIVLMIAALHFGEVYEFFVQHIHILCSSNGRSEK